MFDNYLTSEMTGCLGAWDTFEARVGSRSDEGVVMAYQGDCDGVVAAAYLLHTLRGHGVDVPRSRLMWVAPEDREYQQLRSFVRQQRPAFLITISIPLENNPEALSDLVGSVQQGLFCFDHHVSGPAPQLDHLVVVNPTPTLELARAKPMPGALFGYLCAERAGRDAAPWLVGVSLVGEGFEEPMRFFFEELSRLHDLPSPGMVGGASGLKQTVYGRIARLLSSNFAAREPEHVALDLATTVVQGSLPGPDELLEAASDRLARTSNSVTTEVRRHVDMWRQRIAAYLAAEPLVKVEVASDLSVTGPVGAVLLSHFPDKVFATYSTRGASSAIELRGPDGGRDLAQVLGEISTSLPLHVWGGQPMAAGAVLAADRLAPALEALSAKLDPNWSDDDDDE